MNLDAVLRGIVVQHIGVRETWDEDPGIASRDDNHLISHTSLREYASETRRRQRLSEPPRLDCKAVGRAMGGKNQKENIFVGIQAVGCDLQRPSQGFDRCT